RTRISSRALRRSARPSRGRASDRLGPRFAPPPKPPPAGRRPIRISAWCCSSPRWRGPSSGRDSTRRAPGSPPRWPSPPSRTPAASPDTHIARKLGAEAAVTVQRRARAVVDAGGVRTTAGRDAIAALDRELRDEANTLNPGATADLTGAAIYVVLLEGGWRGRP